MLVEMAILNVSDYPTRWETRNFLIVLPVQLAKIKTINEVLEGGPSIPYPFNYFEKYPISLK